MRVELAPDAGHARFSGSYDPEDVEFLLKPITSSFTGIAEKERLIQSGQRHYSEMIAPERLPSDEYLELFHEALARNGERLATDVATLAATLVDRAQGEEIVIASLARAGTPIGVLLRRVLRAWGVRAIHYSLSIIRDRGIDEVALAHIAARHDPRDVVFVDGWTGKGAIAAELRRSLAGHPQGFTPTLAVIADPAGQADIAAAAEDYLIASGLLNGIISGLVSRSILSRETVGPSDFHACVILQQFAAHDLSRWFVDQVKSMAATAPRIANREHAKRRPALRQSCEAMVQEVMAVACVADRNRVKPGIAEATRALLRRVPDRLFLRDATDPDVRHLLQLADAQGVAVEQLPIGSSYRAVAVIAEMSGT